MSINTSIHASAQVRWSVDWLDDLPSERPRMEHPHTRNRGPVVVERVGGLVSGPRMDRVLIRGRRINKDGALAERTVEWSVYDEDALAAFPHSVIVALTEARSRYAILTRLIAEQEW